MASSGGKKGKKKWKTVPLDDLIESGGASRKITWADEVDRELDVDSCDYPSNKTQNVVLPTAPRASRGAIVDETKIPSSGPFQAYVSNLPYEVTETELATFFKDLKIKNVRLPKEERGGRPTRGYGYIEFDDRASLIAALNQSDTMIKGRQINIELATNHDGGGRGGSRGGGRGSRDGPRDNMGPDRTFGNWRSGSRAEEFDDRDRGQGHGSRREFGGSSFNRGFDREDRGFGGRDDRGGGGGFGSRDDHFRREDRAAGSSFGRDDRGFRDERDGGGFSRGDRFGDREGFDRGGGGFRERGFRDDDRDDRSSFGRFDDRKDRFGPPKREERALGGGVGGGGAGEPKMRTKLQLKPRSSDTAEHSDAPSNQSSIFGGAKPVDTSARDREIEERLAKHHEELGRSHQSSREKSSDWSEERKAVEPAPPPKENAWSSRRTNPTPINNGRSSPDEDVNSEGLQQEDDDDEGEDEIDEKEAPHNEPKRLETKRSEDTRGKGGIGGFQRGPGEKPRGRDSDRQSSKQRDSRRDNADDISRLPRVQDTSTPNFAGENKFSSLITDVNGD